MSIAIISYDFYPVNKGGTHRPFRMAKFLALHGHKVYVCTRPTSDIDQDWDHSLARQLESAQFEIVEIPENSSLLNWTAKLYTKYYVNVLDPIYSSWGNNLIKYLDVFIRQREVTTIILTVPPFSLTKTLSTIKEKYPSVSLILDLRDAWSLWNIAPYATKFHYLLTKNYEKKALLFSDHVLFTSKVTLEDALKHHKSLNPKKAEYIPNSFDSFYEANSIERKEIVISYVGSFYYDPKSERLSNAPWFKKYPWQWFQFKPIEEEWIYRSPYFFFKAIRILLDKDPFLKRRLKINIFTNSVKWLEDMIGDLELAEVVDIIGFIEKEELLPHMAQSDYFLLTSAKRHGGPDYSVAGKTFEYFRFKKPILAFVKEGAQRDILEESGTSIYFDPDRIDENSKKLSRLFRNKKKTIEFPEKLLKFETENVLKPLLKLIK